MKKLGFGCMRLPMAEGSSKLIDKAQFCRMIDTFLANGFSYFDTAWVYAGSEEAIRECLVQRHPRSSFLLADKMPMQIVDQEQQVDAYFNKQLERCGVDYFDYYLAHDMGLQRYETAKDIHLFAYMAEMKKAGRIRNIGFSFHDTAEVLEKILMERPEVDFVQLQLNYLDWENPSIQSAKCLEIAKKYAKPVVVMEPVKGGTLAKLPAEAEKKLRAVHPAMSNASWAIRFAASQDNVMLVLSGMSSMAQMEDNISYMKSFVPLNAREHAVIEEITGAINESIAIPCTGCAYCTPGCPMSIPIPRYLWLYNADLQELKEKTFTAQGNVYAHLTRHHARPNDCIGCGRCEEMCPQHLPIRELLATVGNYFKR